MPRVKVAVTRPCPSCGVAIVEETYRCKSCGAWALGARRETIGDGTIALSEASIKKVERLRTGPWDRCFGGGLAKGTTALLGGAPGAGKSTMSLQMSGEATKLGEVVYIAAEENAAQIRERAARLEIERLDRIRLVPLRDGFDGDLGEVLTTRKPVLVIVDSLPGLAGESLDDAVSFCQRFSDFAGSLNAPIVILDHVTKEDEFAGKMAVQHVVDATFALFPYESGECEERFLHGIKNRNGPTLEMCLRMTSRGFLACMGCAYCKEDDDDETEK